MLNLKLKKTWVVGTDGEWRAASMADKFCIPPAETEQPDVQEGKFKVGCKVPTHNGPLKKGWEVNHQWDESLSEDRQSPSAGIKNGQLRPDHFDELTDFANCLANVLKLIEGAAYRPETQMNEDFTEVIIFKIKLITCINFTLYELLIMSYNTNDVIITKHLNLTLT